MQRAFVNSATRCVSATLALMLACGCAGRTQSGSSRSASYDDLVSLFREWRVFQQPALVDGAPNYAPAAMASQYGELERWRSRLAAIDPSGWPIARQADWHIVRAEMNGLDFDHRVLKPWADNPAFYVTVFADESDQPAREGPFAAGGVDLWALSFPLSAADADRLSRHLCAIPRLLSQARSNLTGNQRDLWTYGAGALREQSADLKGLLSRLAGSPPSLEADVRQAIDATDAFASWVEAQARTKTGPSGVGVEHYNWYLRHVQLVPYTWAEEVALMRSELARAHASLAIEEQRNANLPPQEVVASAEEHARRFSDAVTQYMAFLENRRILTVKPHMEPALRARIGQFRPGPREFFTEVDYRDPEVMRTHGFHWFDKAWMVNEAAPSPVRAGALLYNIFDTRTEGLATGWEEMMMLAGMFDDRPRSRELIYILVAQRAARALGELYMHANTHSLDEAALFAAANTPRGWLKANGSFVRGEQHLYLQQPGYGTSYLIGKIQIEELMAARRRQLGDRLTFGGFMDELLPAGLVPMSLITWQLTGERPSFLP